MPLFGHVVGSLPVQQNKANHKNQHDGNLRLLARRRGHWRIVLVVVVVVVMVAI
jgi:hypothetical protein